MVTKAHNAVHSVYVTSPPAAVAKLDSAMREQREMRGNFTSRGQEDHGARWTVR